jgi:hypothetical protein
MLNNRDIEIFSAGITNIHQMIKIPENPMEQRPLVVVDATRTS